MLYVEGGRGDWTTPTAEWVELYGADDGWQKTNLLASRSPLGQPTSGPNPNPNPDPNPNPNPNLNPGPDLNPLAQPTSGAHAHARRMRAALRGTWLGCGGEACP